jgi:hypothetical protein
MDTHMLVHVDIFSARLWYRAVRLDAAARHSGGGGANAPIDGQQAVPHSSDP